MPFDIDDTHDARLESWVESANDPKTEFPIQNLPLCAFVHPEHDIEVLGARIGDMIVDLATLHDAGLLGNKDHQDHEVCDALEAPDANGFGALSGAQRAKVRKDLQRFLTKGAPGGQQTRRIRENALFRVDTVELIPPMSTQDYTDFYASLYHATNVGSMFRPDNPLLPNYKHIPIGYHGRASSIVPSGTPVRRPVGQQAPKEDGGSPGFGPCKLLDYELEVGAIIGRGNDLGEAISIEQAEDHILGLCLVNDWSARDLQKWEYQPLGPFLAKNFATTVSPYIVMMEALAPFRAPAFERDAGDPTPMGYMDSPGNRARGNFDITLEVHLSSEKMRAGGIGPVRLSRGSFQNMYWTLAQMVAHHTVNGCNLQPGDLLASGTVSGPTRDARGAMIELTWDGDPFANPPVLVPGTQRTAIQLPTGEERTFLADGDEVILRGFCERDGYRRIGFGECRGVVTPARSVE
jgi:fumarylacetoacetase